MFCRSHFCDSVSSSTTATFLTSHPWRMTRPIGHLAHPPISRSKKRRMRRRFPWLKLRLRFHPSRKPKRKKPSKRKIHLPIRPSYVHQSAAHLNPQLSPSKHHQYPTQPTATSPPVPLHKRHTNHKLHAIPKKLARHPPQHLHRHHPPHPPPAVRIQSSLPPTSPFYPRHAQIARFSPQPGRLRLFRLSRQPTPRTSFSNRMTSFGSASLDPNTMDITYPSISPVTSSITYTASIPHANHYLFGNPYKSHPHLLQLTHFHSEATHPRPLLQTLRPSFHQYPLFRTHL